MSRAMIPPRLAPLLAQVSRNPRLQAGLIAIALIIVAWAMLALGDLRRAGLKQLERDHERLARIKQLAGQNTWGERSAEAQTLNRILAAEIPPARSPGLAQAEFQGWLREIVNAQGQALRLETQAPAAVESVPGVVQVTSVISGSLSPDRVIQMLQRIEGHAQLVTVPLATIRDDGANQTFSLTVRGFYRLQPVTPSEASP